MSDRGGTESITVAPDIEEAARLWGGNRWARYLFPGFWLVYLGQPIQSIADHQRGSAAIAGYVLVAAFAVTYLAALPMTRSGCGRPFWWLYGVSIGLAAATCVFAHQDGFVLCVYLAVLTVATRRTFAAPMVLALVACVLVVPALVPSWHAPVQYSNAVVVLLVAVAMWGFFNVVRANMALSAARAEVARLAAENERSRIARDLHDLLGHSLTTITVKAGLARRLAERGDAARSQAEITEVEQLSRRTLGDVRAAVAGHREVTLAGELATAREVLRAAGIAAELPGSVDIVDTALSEPYGWVVREGVTNVVRHSRASHVWITLGPRWVEITDDGKGGIGAAGNGISGLRERLGAAGGTLLATGGFTGFRLRAEVPGDVDLTPAECPAAEPVQT